VNAPFNRVLWSMQVGVVAACAGIGILLVSRYAPTGPELALRVLGVATLSIGIGFALSSLASIFLSRRLGLASPQPQPSTEL
jgi:hypothetical protein